MPDDTYNYTYDPDDAYVYSGTSALVNRFGIEDPDELARVERAIEPAELCAAYIESMHESTRHLESLLGTHIEKIEKAFPLQ